MINPITWLRKFIDDSIHVLSVSYKPAMEHYMQTLKIVLLGTLLLGFMGYIISIIVLFIA